MNQKLIVNVLKRHHHEVIVAHRGNEAVEWIQREPFDMVLVDVPMPVMDGLQATAAIRAMSHDARRRIPILAMTAHAMQGDRERCLAAGRDAYLVRPVESRRLLELIENPLGPANRQETSPLLHPSRVRLPWFSTPNQVRNRSPIYPVRWRAWEVIERYWAR